MTVCHYVAFSTRCHVTAVTLPLAAPVQEDSKVEIEVQEVQPEEITQPEPPAAAPPSPAPGAFRYPLPPYAR
eukprot:1470963-Rhodomonas_salina.1